MDNFTCPTAQYSPSASLIFTSGEKTIQRLFSTNREVELGYTELVTYLAIYFILACWASGTDISCGLVVPMLIIGGLYGRLLGKATLDIFGVAEDSYWTWVDQGAFALLGAVSFFAGVTRLTVSLAVIMVEVTNDVQFLLFIIVTILFAKWTGDFFTRSIYHSLIEAKCVPYLEAEPVILKEGGKFGRWQKVANLEGHQAREVMASPVLCLREKDTLAAMLSLLQHSDHGGFPVVTEERNTFTGLITRTELMVIISKIRRSLLGVCPGSELFLDLTHHDFLRPPSEEQQAEVLRWKATDVNLLGTWMDLKPFVNTSIMTVHTRFSLHRTYNIFRKLGLRHLVVVDDNYKVTCVIWNQSLFAIMNRTLTILINCKVAGIITRKDLMAFNIEEKL